MKMSKNKTPLKIDPYLVLTNDELSRHSPSFNATTSAYGLYNTNQFVLRLSPIIHGKLEEIGGGIKSDKDFDFSYVQAMSTLLHETVHWWQHIGSTYGFIFSLNYPLQAHVTHFDLLRLVEKDGFKKSVFTQSVLLGPTINPGIDSAAGLSNKIINNHFDILSFRKYTLGVKDATQIVSNKLFESVGHTIHMTYGHTLAMLATTVDRDFRCIPHPKEWEGQMLRLKTEQVEGYYYGSNVNIYPLGSAEIFEGQARFAQIQYLYYASGNEIKWLDLRKQKMLDGIYVFAFERFLEGIHESWPDEIDSPLVGLFLLVCDLSLNPGAGFPFKLILHFESFLNDVNPGYRFCMFCMLIRVHLPHLKGFFKNYDRAEYETASEQLCSLCHEQSPLLISGKFSGWFNNTSVFTSLKGEFEAYQFKPENFLIRHLFSHFLDFQSSKFKFPEFFCWPGVWMAGDKVSSIGEVLFENHSALFVDKKDDDGVFARLQRRFSDDCVENTFKSFYDGIVSCDLTNQWIAQNGTFTASLGWLKMHATPDESIKYASDIFSSTYKLDINQVSLLEKTSKFEDVIYNVNII